jgi:hypothetical protein
LTSAAWVKEALAVHGAVAPQPASDWGGRGDLPNSVAGFYQQVGPVNITIPGYGNPYFLPSLNQLWEHQMGYSYLPDGEPITDWPSDWLVVADEGGDPFIHAGPSGQILHDLHGQGVWEPEFLFDDIYQMAGCLALIGTVVVDAGEDLTDEESFITPGYLARARDRLTWHLGSLERAAHVLGQLGWCAKESLRYSR